MEEVRLEIPMAALSSLPEAAEYRVQNGRASATVRSKGDTIVVWATCDSLQRQCERYEREVLSYKTALEEQKKDERTEREQRSKPVKAIVIAFIVGVATGTVVTIITRRKWQRQY